MSTRVTLELPAEAAAKLAAMTPEELAEMSRAIGFDVQAITTTRDSLCDATAREVAEADYSGDLGLAVRTVNSVLRRRRNINAELGEYAQQQAKRLANALAIFILDKKLHAYLKTNDPKALEQAINAINGYDPKMIEGKMPKSSPSFPVPHTFESTEPGSDTCRVCGKYDRYTPFHGPLTRRGNPS